jgi:hypothetical protein
MYEKMFSGKTRSLGISRLEIGFFALLVVFVGLLAVTKYLDLSILIEDSMEQGVIRGVREGIAAYAGKSRDRGSASLYPPALDEAETGDATPQNLFFSNVLQRGIAVEGWTKAGQYEYRVPTGNKFIYDPQTGSFETHGSMATRGMDHSSQTPQPDAGDR